MDELQTFAGNKRNKLWIVPAVNHNLAGIWAWVIGERRAETFKPLWLIVKCWQCFFALTDGWKVYRMFIEDGDPIVNQTYLTRVEGENTRLRYYARMIAPQNLVLLQIRGNVEVFTTPTAPVFEVWHSSSAGFIHYSFSNALS